MRVALPALDEAERCDGGGGGERAAGEFADPMTVRAERREEFVIHPGDGAIETFSIQCGHRAELAGKRAWFAMRLLRWSRIGAASIPVG